MLFLTVALPWHILMLNEYGSLFFDEYIIKHHILRFLGSEVILRNEPVWFYILTLLWGLFPWVFSLLFNIKKPCKLCTNDNYNKNSVIILNSILAFVLFAAPFICFFVSQEIYKLIKPLQIAGIIIISLYLILSGISLKYNKKFLQFISIIFLMSLIFGLITPLGYKLDYSFGQNDLMKYAQIAKTNRLSITAYKTGRRYSP